MMYKRELAVTTTQVFFKAAFVIVLGTIFFHMLSFCSFKDKDSLWITCHERSVIPHFCPLNHPLLSAYRSFPSLSDSWGWCTQTPPTMCFFFLDKMQLRILMLHFFFLLSNRHRSLLNMLISSLHKSIQLSSLVSTFFPTLCAAVVMKTKSLTSPPTNSEWWAYEKLYPLQTWAHGFLISSNTTHNVFGFLTNNIRHS